MKLLIVDGNSLINRAFYALPYLTGGGYNTGGVFGLTTMIFQLFEDYEPTHFLVAFDKKGKTFRHAMYEEYKGNRKGMPPELAEQMPLAKKVLDLMGISRSEIEGYEADDIIGTVSKTAIDMGIDTYIFTGDKDALQLISFGAKVCITKKGVSNLQEYDEDLIKKEFGVSAAQIIDFKGLSGDKSDNIPGIPGVGPKKAEQLLTQFGTVENMVENYHEIKNKRLRELVETYREQAVLSKELATIVCDAPLAFDQEALKLHAPDMEGLKALFLQLEFKSLLGKLKKFEHSLSPDVSKGKAMSGERDENEPTVEIKKQENEGKVKSADHTSSALRKSEDFSLHESTNREDLFKIKKMIVEMDEKMINKHGLLQKSKQTSLEEEEMKPFIIVESAPGESRKCWKLSLEEFVKLKPMLEDANIEKVCFNAKPILLICKKMGIEFAGLVFDVSIAAFMVDPLVKNDMEHLSYQYGVYKEDGTISLEDRGMITQKLWDLFVQELEIDGLTAPYHDIELPLIEVLADMEFRGFKVDEAYLNKIGEGVSKKLATLQAEIYELAGMEFNIDSPKQLGEVLFDKLGLPHFKKTKTGYSTDKKVLSKLVTKHMIVGKVLNYRTYAKLMSTYVEGLKSQIEDGRIHTSLLQDVVVTGRLSSKDPNLQNIPIRLDEGRELRKIFIADEGCTLIDADYSQIELRVLAHLSGDQRLVEAFNHGEDIHAITASQVFGVSQEEVTPLQRSRAKEVNFGIVYGMGDYGLSQSLSIPVKEARQYIEGYFATYPGVRRFMDQVLEDCRKTGYVETIVGRRRRIPGINTKNYITRSGAERMARNTPIQGSAADIIKIAMVDLYKKLKDQNMKSYILLQVHDELILNVYPDEKPEAEKILRECMEHAYKLSIPLKVDIKEGKTWYESK